MYKVIRCNWCQLPVREGSSCLEEPLTKTGTLTAPVAGRRTIVYYILTTASAFASDATKDRDQRFRLGHDRPI